MGNGLTTEQMWEDIIAAHKLEAPPEDALCVIQFAEKINKSEKHARDILNKYVRDGIMASEEFRRPQDNKRARYYWPTRKND